MIGNNVGLAGIHKLYFVNYMSSHHASSLNFAVAINMSQSESNQFEMKLSSFTHINMTKTLFLK